MPPATHRPRTRAFGRTDLVATLATVGLLALVAVGTAGSTRASARATGCLANLRRLSSALSVYAQDNADYLPHPGWGSIPNSPPGWAYAVANPGTIADVPVRGLIPDAAGYMDGSERVRVQMEFMRIGQLWPYVRDDRAFRCPADIPVTGRELVQYRGRSVKVTSFAMNGCVSGNDQQLPGGRTYRIGSFRADDVVFMEPLESEPVFFNDTGNQPGEGVTQRHSGGTHVGRVDGAAEWMSLSNYTALANPAKAVPPNRLYCGPRHRKDAP